MRGDPALPTELIFFVTSRCHLRCKHCFNWKELQRNRDLTLTEIESLAKSLPELKTLMMSGGEPFLRKDLAEICRLFADNCQLNLIDIPTAGTLVPSTVATVEEILKLPFSFNLSVGVSIDGMEAYHDANRGVPGTFAKAIECCGSLLELKKKYKRLSVNILTTLVQDNKGELLELKRFVAEQLPGVDDLSCVIARGDVKEGSLGDVSPDDLAAVEKELLDFNAPRQSPRHRALMEKLFELRRRAFLEKVQPVPCVAGKRIAVVYDDGGVAPCELLPQAGNLRDLPFEAIWRGEAMRAARKGIRSGKCACTHECFLSPSCDSFLLQAPLTYFRLSGWYALYHLLYLKLRVGLVTRSARKMAARLGWPR